MFDATEVQSNPESAQNHTAAAPCHDNEAPPNDELRRRSLLHLPVAPFLPTSLPPHLMKLNSRCICFCSSSTADTRSNLSSVLDRKALMALRLIKSSVMT